MTYRCEERLAGRLKHKKRHETCENISVHVRGNLHKVTIGKSQTIHSVYITESLISLCDYFKIFIPAYKADIFSVSPGVELLEAEPSQCIAADLMK